MTTLPNDRDSRPIPALRLKSNAAQAINVTSTSNRNTTPFDASTRIVSLFATGPVFVRFGDSSVTATATDHYFPAGVYYDFAIGGDKVEHTPYISVIRADVDCTLYVSEKT